MSIKLIVEKELNENQALWRYMDLAKFISMLEQEALWLARVDTLKDKHEGRFPDEMKHLLEKAYLQFDDSDKSPVKNADDFQDYVVKNTFVSCWHKNFDENMVMWEIYGRDNNAVAVKTNVGDIESHIDSSALTGNCFNMRNITYKRADEIRGEIPYENSCFIKRPHFSYEQEVRISLDRYMPHNSSKNTPYGYQLPVDLNKLINEIVIRPDSPDWFHAVVKSITDKYGIKATVSRGKYGTT